MSLSLFTANMTVMMNDPDSISNFQLFGQKLTNEYDMLVKRSFQSYTDPIRVSSVNKQGMESMVIIALQTMLQKTGGVHSIIYEIGKGVVMYWRGATLSNFPPPLTPAIGTIVNISTVSAPVTNAGTFPNLGPQQPINNTSIFLNVLTNAIRIHSRTLSGMYNTMSLYPTSPSVTPAPGVLPWSGFVIQ